MALTGHRSLATFLRYFQPGASGRTRTANLLSRAAPLPHERGATAEEAP